jgi:hypothetical protein
MFERNEMTMQMPQEGGNEPATSERKSFYCEFLRISTPSIDDYIHHRKTKPIHLFALAILTYSRPMTVEEVAEFLVARGWKPATGNPVLSLKKSFAGRLPLVQLADGKIDLELNSIELRMRLDEIGIRVTRNPDAPFRSMGASVPLQEAASKPKRAIIHGFYVDEQLVALTLLDVDQRSIETLHSEDAFLAASHLNQYTVLIGLNPRLLLNRIGINDVLPWRLIDLAHHPKSKQINKSGRKLAITTEMMITSSTGISKPLGDSIKMHEYYRHGKLAALTKRLESDAKSLFAFYSYGSLHNFIRLRWGFLSEWYVAEWGVPGEPSLYDFMKQKITTGEPIEFVRGTAPGWSEPWSRGKTGVVKAIDHQDVELQINGEYVVIPREEFQAVRSHPVVAK